MLPDLEKEICVRTPRSSDNEYLLNKNKILDNLWRFVPKLDKYTESRIICAALEKMSSRDIRCIINELTQEEYGLQTRAKYICSECRSENILEVPLSEAFFTLS